ncbi:MAG: hypothetical protein JWO37_3615 [Acidimicrobiales bacterium]|nr:hypothetical protein [Acidimicrobiales bacterium]
MFGLRKRVGRMARRTAEWADERTYLRLEYPPTADNAPRWGWGKPNHERLTRLLEQREPTIARALAQIATFADDLASLPLDDPGAGTPHWRNRFCRGLDAAAIYGFVRGRRPRRYVEIGSGMSTMFAARAKADGGSATEITSIDPFPRAEIDRLCDVVIRQPLEAADLAVFDGLGAGDIVFMDGSHRTFMNSDATVFFLDVLPALPSGVVVGVDDVLLPSDYFPEWADRFYSEQYLLAAYLLGDSPWIAPLLPCNWVTDHPTLQHGLDALWHRPHLRDLDRRGTSWWFTIDR